MTTTTRTSRTRWAIAIAVLAGGLLAGCSTPPADDSAGAGPNDTGNAFAACLRHKGYDVADPSGDTAKLEIPEGADPDRYARDAADCAEESSGTEAGAGQAAEEYPGSADIAREVATCLREHGFADYPDDPDAAREYQPTDEHAFAAAAQQCETGAGLPDGAVADG